MSFKIPTLYCGPATDSIPVNMLEYKSSTSVKKNAKMRNSEKMETFIKMVIKDTKVDVYSVSIETTQKWLKYLRDNLKGKGILFSYGMFSKRFRKI